MKTPEELFAEAKAATTEIPAREVLDRATRGEAMVLVDVREQNEWNLGHVAGAQHIALRSLEAQIAARVARDAQVVVYCATGNRSILAAHLLSGMGYANVASMAGGIRDWVAAGGTVDD